MVSKTYLPPPQSDYLVESYSNGTSWYRLYKSGWCEQGGIVNWGGTGSKSLTLIVPYKDTNYHILQSFGCRQTSDFSSNVTMYPSTTSVVVGYAASSVATNHEWRAYGYT